MNKERVIILDKERIDKKLQRMAYQIWEHNSNEKGVTLVGIEKGGHIIAKSLGKRLEQISPLKVEVISLHVDKKNLLTNEVKIDHKPKHDSVILVDDVANSGKTMLHALRPFMAYELKKLMVAVLVDRKHKRFPVSSDIVGHSLATTLHDNIEVETKGDEIIAAYLQ